MFLEAVRFLRRDKNWAYTWPTLERLAIRWIGRGHLDEGAVVLGYLDAHGWGADIDAADRACARSAVAEQSGSMRRGATMDRHELVGFVLSILEALTSSATLRSAS